MGAIKRFEDLEVWISSRKLANLIYDETNSGVFSEDFGLKNQIRRSVWRLSDLTIERSNDPAVVLMNVLRIELKLGLSERDTSFVAKDLETRLCR
jgi:hypothetical protein